MDNTFYKYKRAISTNQPKINDFIQDSSNTASRFYCPRKLSEYKTVAHTNGNWNSFIQRTSNNGFIFNHSPQLIYGKK